MAKNSALDFISEKIKSLPDSLRAVIDLIKGKLGLLKDAIATYNKDGFDAFVDKVSQFLFSTDGATPSEPEEVKVDHLEPIDTSQLPVAAGKAINEDKTPEEVKAWQTKNIHGYENQPIAKATYNKNASKEFDTPNGKVSIDYNMIINAERECNKGYGKDKTQEIVGRKNFVALADSVARIYDVPVQLMLANTIPETNGVFSPYVTSDKHKTTGKPQSLGLAQAHHDTVPDFWGREDGIFKVKFQETLGPFVQDDVTQMRPASSILYDLCTMAMQIRHAFNQSKLCGVPGFEQHVGYNTKLNDDHLFMGRGAINYLVAAVPYKGTKAGGRWAGGNFENRKRTGEKYFNTPQKLAAYKRYNQHVRELEELLGK